MWNWFAKPTPLQEPVVNYEQSQKVNRQTRLSDCEFLVVDIETTGLDAQRHQIISIGWLLVQQRQVMLETANYQLIRLGDGEQQGVGQSATIHGLHNHQVANGEELSEVLSRFLQIAAKKVLVAHHSVIEQQFLRKACQQCFGRAPQLKFIDTLQLEAKQLQRRNITVRQDEYRLPACLKRHQLPLLQEHNALEDAFGCALLLQKHLAGLGEQATLADLLNSQ